MQKISRQQALNRWDTLPDNLKEALFSEYNSETLWRICEGQHLSEDKISVIAILTGDVILGFLHPEDLASEIKKDVGLISELANLIASEIDRKIFTSIRSDLEKVYAPALEGEVEAEERGDEIASPSARNDGKDEAESISIPIEIRKPEAFIVSPSAELRAGKPEPPIKIIEIEEEEKIEEIQSPSVPRVEHLETAAPELPTEGPLVVSEAEPMIIHKETELKPLSESKKSFKSLGGLFGFLKKKEKPEETKPVKAEIEGIGSPKKIEDIKPIETKIKIVNYTEVPDMLTNDQRPTTDDVPRVEHLETIASEKEKERKIEALDLIEPEIEKVEEIKKPTKSPEEEMIDLSSFK